MTPIATEDTTVIVDVDLDQVPECSVCTSAAEWRLVCLHCRYAALGCDPCLMKLYELVEGLTGLLIAVQGDACYTPCCDTITNRVADTYDISLL